MSRADSIDQFLVSAMSLLRKLAAGLAAFFSPARNHAPEQPAEPEPLVRFPSITFVDKPPRNEKIAAGELYYVANGSKPKWSLFKCPCGCGGIVTLSLQTVHRPHWRLSQTHAGRATLYPSVWRDKGCMSHFWLRDGRVYWCLDTGSDPRFRRS